MYTNCIIRKLVVKSPVTQLQAFNAPLVYGLECMPFKHRKRVQVSHGVPNTAADMCIKKMASG